MIAVNQLDVYKNIFLDSNKIIKDIKSRYLGDVILISQEEYHKVQELFDRIKNTIQKLSPNLVTDIQTDELANINNDETDFFYCPDEEGLYLTDQEQTELDELDKFMYEINKQMKDGIKIDPSDIDILENVIDYLKRKLFLSKRETDVSKSVKNVMSTNLPHLVPASRDVRFTELPIQPQCFFQMLESIFKHDKDYIPSQETDTNVDISGDYLKKDSGYELKQNVLDNINVNTINYAISIKSSIIPLITQDLCTVKRFVSNGNNNTHIHPMILKIIAKVKGIIIHYKYGEEQYDFENDDRQQKKHLPVVYDPETNRIFVITNVDRSFLIDNK
jgi:hypothetical protein